MKKRAENQTRQSETQHAPFHPAFVGFVEDFCSKFPGSQDSGQSFRVGHHGNLVSRKRTISFGGQIRGGDGSAITK